MILVSGFAALLLCALGSPARAERPAPATPDAPCKPDGGPSDGGPTDGGCPAGQTVQSDEDLKRELERSLEQDAAANARKPSAVGGGSVTAGSAAPEAAISGNPAPPYAGSSRGAQSLNPDISGIIDANAGYEGRTPAFRSGDDPVLRSTPSSPAAGFTVQEVELALSAVVDPYFKGEIYLTIPNLNGLEIEEAFATTTSLPYSLQVKAGSFRSAFGRQNGQHLHVQDFTRRPLLNSAFLGADGLRGPGAQVSWLTPLPFYLTLYAEAFSLDVPAPGAPIASFGGGSGRDLTYASEAKVFFPLGEDWSLYAGLNGATGVSPNSAALVPALSTPTTPVSANYNRRSVLFGGDLYVKWKPPNVAGGYESLAWQTEIVFRRLGDAQGCASPDPAGCAAITAEWDGGLYSQIVYQFDRRWFLGVRGDVLGLPASSAVPSTLRGALSITFQASEFARLRAYGEIERLGAVRSVPGGSFTLAPDSLASASPRTTAAAYLQLEVSIGAHGAHPF
jgi:hypothetical protein